jgi:hypothetical protein
VSAVGTVRFLFFVRVFDLRRRHGLREGQRQRIPVVGLAWPRFCISALLSSTAHCVAKYTLSRPHPYPPGVRRLNLGIVARRKIGKLEASGIKAVPGNRLGQLDQGGHTAFGILPRVVVISVRWRYRIHPPPPELECPPYEPYFLFVGLLNLRRRHGLREGQRSTSPSSGEACPRFCMSALDSSTSRLLQLMW